MQGNDVGRSTEDVTQINHSLCRHNCLIANAIPQIEVDHLSLLPLPTEGAYLSLTTLFIIDADYVLFKQVYLSNYCLHRLFLAHVIAYSTEAISTNSPLTVPYFTNKVLPYIYSLSFYVNLCVLLSFASHTSSSVI